MHRRAYTAPSGSGSALWKGQGTSKRLVQPLLLLTSWRLTSGLVIAFTPPANAVVQSPWASARQAITTDTSEDEHAVSITMEGPLHPYAYDILPLKKARNVPTSVSNWPCAMPARDIVSHRWNSRHQYLGLDFAHSRPWPPQYSIRWSLG